MLRPLPPHHRLLALAMLALTLCCGTIRAGEPPMISVRVEQRGGAFIVDACGKIPVAPATAWDVLTDFEHMASILNNLSESRIVNRNGNTLTVQQHGTAHYGPFSYDFDSLREIVLEPRRRIVARQISGRAKQFSSVARVTPVKDGTQLRYHAEIEPDGAAGRWFGRPFVQDEINEQLTLMAREMLRREKTISAPESGTAK